MQMNATADPKTAGPHRRTAAASHANQDRSTTNQPARADGSADEQSSRDRCLLCGARIHTITAREPSEQVHQPCGQWVWEVR